MVLLLKQSLRLFAPTFRTAAFRTTHAKATGPGSEEPASKVQSQKSENESIDALRKRVYLETLKHVPELGFTQRAVSRAVHSLGLPPTLNSVFRDGGELALHFYADGNRQTREFMHSHLDAVRRGVEPKMKTNAFIQKSIVHRLNVTCPYAAQWFDAMFQIGSRPGHVLVALDRLSELVDDVWYAAGDRSIDTNWYTKRALLAGVYKSSELYMLSFYSPRLHAPITKPEDQEVLQQVDQFVQRRLGDVMVVGGAIRSAQGALEQAASFGYAAFNVAANVLGVQRPRSY